MQSDILDDLVSLPAGYAVLDSLPYPIIIIDNNNFQQTGSNDSIMSLGDLSAKWKSFNWDVKEINGHSYEEILQSLDENLTNLPRAIIAKTIKGKGVSFFENNNSWHHAVVTKKIYEEAILEIEK